MSDTFITFSDALDALATGETVTRAAWIGGGMRLSRQPATGGGNPVILLRLPNGKDVPWVAQFGDQLANDWMIEEPPPTPPVIAIPPTATDDEVAEIMIAARGSFGAEHRVVMR